MFFISCNSLHILTCHVCCYVGARGSRRWAEEAGPPARVAYRTARDTRYLAAGNPKCNFLKSISTITRIHMLQVGSSCFKWIAPLRGPREGRALAGEGDVASRLKAAGRRAHRDHRPRGSRPGASAFAGPPWTVGGV